MANFEANLRVSELSLANFNVFCLAHFLILWLNSLKIKSKIFFKKVRNCQNLQNWNLKSVILYQNLPNFYLPAWFFQKCFFCKVDKMAFYGACVGLATHGWPFRGLTRLSGAFVGAGLTSAVIRILGENGIKAADTIDDAVQLGIKDAKTSLNMKVRES